ncbi:hypothetical protein C5167_040316 [Papaver somniferum]|uniref:Uncharacterized protein n=1 Tax=Papaver somniferum TaxID=3469 RepID=A0A4Y7IHZ6_PAPSO|nr:hypothetical protein C5167_040316 [Papaver somniferum]
MIFLGLYRAVNIISWFCFAGALLYQCISQYYSIMFGVANFSSLWVVTGWFRVMPVSRWINVSRETQSRSRPNPRLIQIHVF